MGSGSKQILKLILLALGLITFIRPAAADYWDNQPKKSQAKVSLDYAMNRYINNYIDKTNVDRTKIQPSISNKTVVTDLETEFDKLEDKTKSTEREPAAAAENTPENNSSAEETTSLEQKVENP